ncbi:hypothetical protein C0583_05110 [Candidatus Parcubacteria bacterium]|nr:MAG: hypothetical protein C0583_05110 [Candidatus Parcubacteria bacterium]
MNNKVSPLLIAIIIALSFFVVNFSYAQSVGIKISPVIVDELVEPGQILTQQLKVTNVSDEGKQFYVYLRDFSADGEDGAARLMPPGTDTGYTMASWIDITSQAIPLGPNEEKVVNYVVRVPSEIGPGGYRGAILFGTEPPKININSEDKGAGMSISQQAACLLLFQVKGDVDEEAEIREFNTDKDYYSTPFDVNFSIRIENKGNVHLKPYGTVKIENMFGREVEMIRVNEKKGAVLPETFRKFSGINWSGNNAFGKYTATLGLTYGTDVSDGGQGKGSLVSKKSFWIIPWRIIVPVSLVLLFFTVLIIIMLRLYKNRAVRKAMASVGLSQVKYVKKYQGPSPTLHLAMILFATFLVLLLFFFIFYIFFLA